MKVKIDRQKIYDMYDHHCGYCGKELKSIKDMQVDHITPKWMGYKEYDKIHKEDNYMPCCRRCNHYKRGDTLEQFRHKMKTLHERVCSHYIGKVALDYNIVEIKPFDGVFFYEKCKL